MGYYTKYSLSVVSGNIDKDYIKEITVLSDYGSLDHEIKWYEHEDHMKIISSNNPETLFRLHGEGEEGEVWDKLFLNGTMKIIEVDKPVSHDYDWASLSRI
ncbi:hypothetical protein CJD36_018530 [Flavipsychrobacter stenotrophus]|uniref:Uncharacterized protein n=1 Tax=Flavipsychrobacter stenotrophus TaxID=2077091 RepID=A0A2S7SRL3_9BACT|nr:hypothetical protein [Flavipsychrobacter stenotrophus]PQJ09247.1 hypothetical protein CJD36_018530 [Flavipsychrobacter stenotrophus]